MNKLLNAKEALRCAANYIDTLGGDSTGYRQMLDELKSNAQDKIPEDWNQIPTKSSYLTRRKANMEDLILALTAMEEAYNELLEDSLKLNAMMDKAVSDHFIKMQKISTQHIELIRKMGVLQDGIQNTKKLLR